LGAVNFGNALISEGVSDMVQGTIGMITGNFSILDWLKSKAINLLISILCAGLSTLAVTGSAVGQLTTCQSFCKSLARAAIQVVVQVAGELISTYGISKLMELVHASIESNLRSFIREKLDFNQIKDKLKEIRKNKGNIAFKKALNEFDRNISQNVLKDQSVKELISHLYSLANNFNKILKSIDGGDWKKKLAQSLASSAIRLSIDTAVNGLKLLEIPKVIQDVKFVIQSSLEKFDQTLQIEKDFKQELNDNQSKSIDNEIDRICDSVSNRITNDLLGFISGLANGVFKTGVSLSSEAISTKLDRVLDKHFEKSNQIKYIPRRALLSKNEQVENEKSQIEKENLENGVVSPKEIENEELNLADVQLESNKDGRTILILDQTTKKIIIINPTNVSGKFEAIFKQRAKIIFDKNDGEDGSGHFRSGRAQEDYIESDENKNNCLLIAIKESLGKKLDEDYIDHKRESHENYKHKHSYSYTKNEIVFKTEGYEHIIGGAGQREYLNRESRNQKEVNISAITNAVEQQCIEHIHRRLSAPLRHNLLIKELGQKDERLIYEIKPGVVYQDKEGLYNRDNSTIITSSFKKTVNQDLLSTPTGNCSHVVAAHINAQGIKLNIDHLDQNSKEFGTLIINDVAKTTYLPACINNGPEKVIDAVQNKYAQCKSFDEATLKNYMNDIQTGLKSKMNEPDVRNNHNNLASYELYLRTVIERNTYETRKEILTRSDNYAKAQSQKHFGD
jgi:hypothetical protein